MVTPEFNAGSHEFENKCVLVTGGTKGIGQAVAARFGDGGARVLTTARGQHGDPAERFLPAGLRQRLRWAWSTS
jgi:NAD(P)-dependent dehydrogenase (short-subunit alcohol dehydrogenase family)